MTKETELTETQRFTICHALQIAAERFDEHVTLTASFAPGTGGAGLGEQFKRQAADVRAMAVLLESASYIRVGPEEPEESSE